MEELQFWHKCIIDFNGQNIWRSPSAVRVIYLDVSNTGFGGYMVEHGPQIAHGQWSAWEAEQSSAWRELRAVSSVLQSFANSLADERICWFTDNQNVVRILLYGSRKPLLQEEALTVFHLSVTHHLTIEPELMRMIGWYIHGYFTSWTSCGDLTQLTGLIIGNWSGLIPGFGTRNQKLWMHSQSIGEMIPIGGAHQWAWFLG